MTPEVFIGIPTYDNSVCIRTVSGLMAALQTKQCSVAFMNSSLLAHGFNQLWAQGLQSGAKYFAMMHADIGPDADWLGTLIGELEENQADVVSAVVPIKSDEGVYSTALGDGGEPYYRMKYEDWHKVPDTFGAEELAEMSGQAPGTLLVNTGLWVARLGQAWNRQVYFEITSRLVHNGNHVHCGVISEDWLFSYQLEELGCKVLATKKVEIQHQGLNLWSNVPAKEPSIA